MDDLHQRSMEIFARLTDADLQRKCPTPGGVQITTWKCLYLALLGVPTPPLYGLTSEQVRANSES